MVFIAFLSCFLISFLMATVQYGHNTIQYRKGFATSYLILYRISPAFWVYGIAHGIIAIVALHLLRDKLPNEGDQIILLGCALGLGVNGVTNISLYDVKKGNETFSLGTKTLTDFATNSTRPHIETKFSLYVINLINKAEEGRFKDMDIGQLKAHLVRFLPVNTAKVDKEAFNASTDDKNELLRLFVEQYGLEHFNAAKK